jgi:hypothetical protein
MTRDLSEVLGPGALVQRKSQGWATLTPYAGTVESVDAKAKTASVKWAHGVRTETIASLVELPDASLESRLPQSLRVGHCGCPCNHESGEGESPEENWDEDALPPGFYPDLARRFHDGESDIDSYLALSRDAAQDKRDQVLDHVNQFYCLAQSLARGALVRSIRTASAEKTAAYWVARNRRYRVSKTEQASGAPSCPKCCTRMRRVTYKMRDGDRVRLFLCPDDHFLIRETDLVGPKGQCPPW